MSERSIPYDPTSGISYDPSDAVYWDPQGLAGEIQRTFEICHGCRLCFKYCDTFPDLFTLIDAKDGDVRRVTAPETEAVLDTCFQCKLCEVNCPYTERDHHPYRLDFPKLVHRQRAQRTKRRGLGLRARVLGDPDRAARLARASLGLANLMNRFPPARWVMEQTLGIHRRKLLPDFAPRTFSGWAASTNRVSRVPGGEAVLFPTCYVEHNAPEIGRDTVEVLEKNRVDLRCVQGLECCGMPAWEKGDLPSVRRHASRNLRVLFPYVTQGAKVLAVNPTCTMMLRREYPELVATQDRAAAEQVAQATRDPAEYLWSIRDEERFNTDFKSTPGPIAYQAPCHLRTLGIGFKGRDLLKKIPGVSTATVLECSGHDGTFAMSVEGFEPSQRIGGKAFAAMQGAGATTWSTECPLAALQFRQHAGTAPLHPMSILARAYREDGFPERIPTAATTETPESVT